MVGLPSRGPRVLLYAHLPQGKFVNKNEIIINTAVLAIYAV